MTLRVLTAVSLPVLILAPLIVHCGSSKLSGAAQDASTVGSDASPGEDALSGETGATFTYQAAGCPYAVTPPASRGYTDLALDDGTAPVTPADAVPQRVRVGLGGGTTKGTPSYANPTSSAAFTWQTAARTTSAKVRLGMTPGALSDVHAGFVFTAPPPASGFGDTEPPEYMHEAHVCGLAPATTYYYQVGGGAAGQEIWSATQSFTTVPASGKIVVGVFGDSRDSVSTWQLVHQRMRDAAPSLLLVSGDIVDLGGLASEFGQWLDAVWKDPSDPTKFLTLGQFPIVPIAGNHEGESTQFFANFAIPGEGEYAEQYASFDVGNTHFVMVDDQAIALSATNPTAVAILKWLDADLAAANGDRATHPFVVVVSHRSLFSTGGHATDPDVLTVRGALAPLFDRYHVDVVLNGHDHEYERSFPLTAGNPPTGAPVVQPSAAQGTTYVINAGAGADAVKVNQSPAPYRNGSATQYGAGTPYLGCYMLLTLEGTKLTLNAYGMKAGGGGVAGDDVIDTVSFGQ